MRKKATLDQARGWPGDLVLSGGAECGRAHGLPCGCLAPSHSTSINKEHIDCLFPPRTAVLHANHLLAHKNAKLMQDLCT